MQPPYDQLAHCTTWQVGSAAIEQDYAAVLVSTLNNDDQPQAFRFLLRLHGRAPYEGCWLTDAVEVLPTDEIPSDPDQSPKDAKITDPKPTADQCQDELLDDELVEGISSARRAALAALIDRATVASIVGLSTHLQ